MHKIGGIITYFARNLGIVVGIVLVWRGVWEFLSIVEAAFFGGTTLLTAISGIVIGLAILYFPDNDLKELEKL